MQEEVKRLTVSRFIPHIPLVQVLMLSKDKVEKLREDQARNMETIEWQHRQMRREELMRALEKRESSFKLFGMKYMEGNLNPIQWLNTINQYVTSHECLLPFDPVTDQT